MPMARTARISITHISSMFRFIVKTLLDMGMKMKNSEYTMIESAKDIIDWCERDKRTFLLHRIRTKLAFLLYKTVFFHF